MKPVYDGVEFIFSGRGNAPTTSTCPCKDRDSAWKGIF